MMFLKANPFALAVLVICGALMPAYGKRRGSKSKESKESSPSVKALHGFVEIAVTVTNANPRGGECFTPFWFGAHAKVFNAKNLFRPEDEMPVTADGVATMLRDVFYGAAPVSGVLADLVVGYAPICPGDSISTASHFNLPRNSPVYFSFISTVLGESLDADSFIDSRLLFDEEGKQHFFAGAFQSKLFSNEMILQVQARQVPSVASGSGFGASAILTYSFPGAFNYELQFSGDAATGALCTNIFAIDHGRGYIPLSLAFSPEEDVPGFVSSENRVRKLEELGVNPDRVTAGRMTTPYFSSLGPLPVMQREAYADFGDGRKLQLLSGVTPLPPLLNELLASENITLGFILKGLNGPPGRDGEASTFPGAPYGPFLPDGVPKPNFIGPPQRNLQQEEAFSLENEDIPNPFPYEPFWTEVVDGKVVVICVNPAVAPILLSQPITKRLPLPDDDDDIKYVFRVNA